MGDRNESSGIDVVFSIIGFVLSLFYMVALLIGSINSDRQNREKYEQWKAQAKITITIEATASPRSYETGVITRLFRY